MTQSAQQANPVRLHNIRLLQVDSTPLTVLEDAVVDIAAGVIQYAGPAAAAPARDVECIDGHGQLLTPGFIDCHTHLVWAGSRADEFDQRLQGASYADIAAAGGGIMSTVKSTRAATVEELVALALPRARALQASGVTTIEIKSGYGLSLSAERRQLQAARALAEQLPLTVQTTLLAAHAIPPEFANGDAYMTHICEVILPTLVAEGWVDAVDAFCETMAFNTTQVEQLFRAAQQLRVPVKLHAEQLSNQQGSALAARYQALSCDHLEHLDEAGVKAMAAAGTVAVLLPGAFYFLRETTLPPLQLLQQYGVPIAIATDANPGSAPIHNLQLMLQMAATFFRLTPAQCLQGVTVHAAQALGLRDRGRIATGLRADLALWDVQSPAELCYQFGVNPLRQLWLAGVPCYAD